MCLSMEVFGRSRMSVVVKDISARFEAPISVVFFNLLYWRKMTRQFLKQLNIAWCEINVDTESIKCFHFSVACYGLIS